QIKPDYAEAQTNLGGLLVALGQYSEAITELEKALRLQAQNSVSFNDLGFAYVKSAEAGEQSAAGAKYALAETAYREALKIKPDYAKALNNLGAVETKLGKFSDAINALSSAVKLKPDFPEAYYNLGTAYYNNSQLPEAVSSLQHAVDL